MGKRITANNVQKDLRKLRGEVFELGFQAVDDITSFKNVCYKNRNKVAYSVILMVYDTNTIFAEYALPNGIPREDGNAILIDTINDWHTVVPKIRRQ